MLRRSSSHNYAAVDQDDNPANANRDDDPSSETTSNVLLFQDSIRRFSFHIAPDAQKEIVDNVWLSLDTLTNNSHFIAITRQYNLDFAAAAATIQNYIDGTSMQGIVLLRYQAVIHRCHFATLQADNANIKDESKKETSNNNDILLRLIAISDALIKRDTRYNIARNQAIYTELSGINHPAVKNLLNYIDFLRSLFPYVEAIKTRLLHIQASLPNILPTKNTKFFSPHVEDWLSNLDAALKNVTPASSIYDTLSAYELSLIALLTSEPKRHLIHHNNLKTLLNGLSLRDAQPIKSAASRPSV